MIEKHQATSAASRPIRIVASTAREARADDEEREIPERLALRLLNPFIGAEVKNTCGIATFFESSCAHRPRGRHTGPHCYLFRSLQFFV
jgi:hypothetical protein